MLVIAEYIWLDGVRPTQGLRAKTRIVPHAGNKPLTLDTFPTWGFDGSSTSQADGSNSDLVLNPVRFVNDPLRGANHYLVLCEVLGENMVPHASNTRARLRRLLNDGYAAEEPWVGVEQEYTLYREGTPLGWPDNGYPEPQGPYYCGVGADRAFGRELVEAHTRACLDAGLMIYGTNAEVMAGQWEFQIGYRGIDDESADPLTVSDHLWLARYLLLRLGEQFGIRASFDPKPVSGDWNGAGAHTNFSTRAMRDAVTGLDTIHAAIRRLEATHDEHILVYGHGLENRLTGLHETCSIHEFKGGVADRGASIRVPRHVVAAGHGYLEDRRPGANCDPYVVCEALLRSICADAQLARRETATAA